MKVVVAKTKSYDHVAVEAGVDEILAGLGGINLFVNSGEKVLIKPNMLEGLPPEKAVTTHPAVLRAVIKAIKQAGATPVVGDSPGIGSTIKVAEKCGIFQVCQQEGIELLNFKEAVETALPEGRLIKRFTVAKALTEVDKVISVAKMKTHSFMGITGAVKNLFGLIVGTDKAQFHLRMKKRADFADMLIDLYSLAKPSLFLVDGVTAMEGNGPRNGTLKSAGVIMGGANGFAVDLVMGEIMGFNPAQLPVTARALTLGLIPPLEDIELSGSGQNVRLQFKQPYNLESLDGRLPGWLVSLCQEQFTARPAINERCIGCGRCAAHCPPDAIIMQHNRAVIDLKKCIRCYCCQELCPENAVDLKSGAMLKLLRKVRKY